MTIANSFLISLPYALPNVLEGTFNKINKLRCSFFLYKNCKIFIILYSGDRKTKIDVPIDSPVIARRKNATEYYVLLCYDAMVKTGMIYLTKFFYYFDETMQIAI